MHIDVYNAQNAKTLDRKKNQDGGGWTLVFTKSNFLLVSDAVGEKKRASLQMQSQRQRLENGCYSPKPEYLGKTKYYTFMKA